MIVIPAERHLKRLVFCIGYPAHLYNNTASYIIHLIRTTKDHHKR